MPSPGNGPRQQDLPPLNCVPPPGDEYLSGSVSAFGSPRARLNRRRDAHAGREVRTGQVPDEWTPVLGFEIAEAKGPTGDGD